MPAEMKTIPDLADYFAASDGTVWRLKGNTLSQVKARRLKNGYWACNVRRAAGKWATMYVHRLVASAWHGLPPPGAHTRHLDGDKNNAAPANLAWGDPRSNALDKLLHGRGNAGEKNPAAKLTERDVYAVRLLLEFRVPRKDIAQRMGVSVHAIHCVARGETWRNPTAAVTSVAP